MHDVMIVVSNLTRNIRVYGLEDVSSIHVAIASFTVA